LENRKDRTPERQLLFNRRKMNITEFLDHHNGPNVMFCYGTSGVIDLAKNMLSNRHGMNIVFFALDFGAASAMRQYCEVVDYFDPDTKGTLEVGTPEFKKAVWSSWIIGNEILKRGKSYIYIDLDCVILQNFEDELLNRLKHWDCVIQAQDVGCCCGLYGMAPNERTIDLITEPNYNYPDDEHYFNTEIFGSNRITICKLRRRYYPDGNFYAKDTEIRINTDRKPWGYRLVHFNRTKNKIQEIKQAGLWNGLL